MMCFKHAIFPFSCHNALLCVCQFYITDYNNGSRLGAYCKLKNCSFQILSWRNILKICIFWIWTSNNFSLPNIDSYKNIFKVLLIHRKILRTNHSNNNDTWFLFQLKLLNSSWPHYFVLVLIKKRIVTWKFLNSFSRIKIPFLWGMKQENDYRVIINHSNIQTFLILCNPFFLQQLPI